MRSQLVSIILPTFNRGYCLPAAIDSVRAQSHPNWELIVIDDGSTDDTRELMSRYAGDDRVRYVWQANGGVAAARNTGLALARGNFIAFLDSDDTWKPFKLRLQLDVMGALPDVGMVWTEMDAVRPDGCTESPAYLAEMYDNYRRFPKDKLFSSTFRLDDLVPSSASPMPEACVYSGSIFSAMVAGNLVHTSTVLLRRDVAQRVGAFNEQLRPTGEDFDFHLRTCRETRVALVDVATITYMTGRDDQLTSESHQHRMAVNYLRTITPVIEHDRHLLHWSDRQLSELRAGAHAWAGMSCYYDDDYEPARRHLVASLRQRWDWRVAFYAGLTTLPSNALGATRRAARALSPPDHDDDENSLAA